MKFKGQITKILKLMILLFMRMEQLKHNNTQFMDGSNIMEV